MPIKINEKEIMQETKIYSIVAEVDTKDGDTIEIEGTLTKNYDCNTASDQYDFELSGGNREIGEIEKATGRNFDELWEEIKEEAINKL
jgi:hypothetical protein